MVKQNDTIANALKHGGPVVWGSCLIMGLGNLAAGQIIKGLLFLAIEIGVILFLTAPGGGLSSPLRERSTSYR